MSRIEEGSWRGEVNDLARAVSGAFIFGMPLLFTMEMWWIGSSTEAGKLLLILVLSIGVNAMLAHFEGFRRGSTPGESLAQAIEAVALGAVAAAVVLAALNRIGTDEPLLSVLGQIIVLAMPLSIGASIANAVFRNRDRDDADEQAPEPSGSGLRATLVDIGITIGGGIFIGFTIAPTEEVAMLTAEMDVWHVLAVIALSLFLSYVIVFESGFQSQERAAESPGPFQLPVTETVLSYIVSLAVAFGTLFIFNQVSFSDPCAEIVSKTIVLGLPTALGGAAGRLLI